MTTCPVALGVAPLVPRAGAVALLNEMSSSPIDCAIDAVTGLLFGVAPAAQSANLSLVSALQEGSPGTTAGSTGRRLRGVLVLHKSQGRVAWQIDAKTSNRSQK